MVPLIYSSENQAGIETPKFKAYYGPDEIELETGDWCFVVWKNGKEVFRRTNSELTQIHEGSPAEMLLTGLSLFLIK